jgi:plastocyanin
MPRIHCLVVLVFVLCAGAQAATTTVNVNAMTFSPAEVTINAGDTVTWVWFTGTHSTTSDTNIWDSDFHSTPGFNFSHTFPGSGTFPYYCRIHGAPGGVGMSGVVIVSGGTSKADTTTALSSSANPSTASQNVTFTATVSVVASGGGTPTGTVTFKDGQSAVCSNVTLSSASATCSTSALSVGSHSMTATYSGDVNFNTSASSVLTQTVNSSGPPAPPASLSATATSDTNVQLVWNTSTNATSYDVYRNSIFAFNTPNTLVNDGGRSINTTYLYKVKARNSAGPSDFSNVDAATTTMFTDPTLSATVKVKALHINELRTAVSAMRAAAGLEVLSWGEPIASGTLIKAAHINELRAALASARSNLGLPAITFADDPLPAGATVKSTHVLQLRSGTQ